MCVCVTLAQIFGAGQASHFRALFFFLKETTNLTLYALRPAQVAYLWAKSLGGDSAVKLLTKFDAVRLHLLARSRICAFGAVACPRPFPLLTRLLPFFF